MTAQDFLEKTAHFLKEEKPFVIYKKPNSNTDELVNVTGFFQEDNQLYFVKDYLEAGFVFAPFQLNKKSVLIPLDKSEMIQVKMTVKTSSEKHSAPKNISDETAKKQHLNLVEKGVNAIRQKEFQKVVLSRKIKVEIEKETLSILQELIENYPTAFVYCWHHPKVGLWLGATPETLLSVTGNRLKTMAVAGTKAVKYADASKNKTENPIWTSKEIEEQQIVTDAIKDELIGKIPQLHISETHNYRAGSLWHLKTDITGMLPLKASEGSLKEIVENLHPTPAVCGLPKKKAEQFIIQHENYDREFYTGFLGELNLKVKTTRSSNRRNQENQAYAAIKKESHLFVNLRCMQLTKGIAQIYVGGGIVKDSNPESEWEETQNKSQTMLKVL